MTALEVFEPRDPLPPLFAAPANWLHSTTRSYVIEQEVLLAVGERYDQALVDRTARNLRALSQLSLVLVVALQGSAPDRVRLLVITKDVWSLRLNSSWVFENGRLLQLVLQPSESNLFGTHQLLLGQFILDPATISLGGQYSFPRIARSRVSASAAADVILNRDTHKAEGSYGSVVAGLPLYSTRTEWAWSAAFSWDREIRRRFVGGLATDFDAASGTCVVPSAAATFPDASRCQYRRSVTSATASLTLSFGVDFKRDLTLAFLASRSVFNPFDLSPLPAADQAAFLKAVLPTSDSQVGPSLELHAYSSVYLDLLDFDTLGLTENVQRGPDLTLRVRPITTALGSSRNFVDLFAGAQYTLPLLGDGLARAQVQSDTELASGDLPDASLDASLRLVSPRLGVGRVVFDVRLLDRYRNHLNLKSALGGDTRLRGYPAGLFVGANLALGNLEFRSRPIQIFAVQLGAVVFADAGDAFDEFDRLRLKHSAGFGLRWVFPQFQRYVMRLDLGFPLTRTASVAPGRPDVVITFAQALPALGN